MKINLYYVEGEHDEVPGVLRYLAHNVSKAQKLEASIEHLGGKPYRQTLPVEIPYIYSHLEMEAALCVWEWLNDITVCTDKPDPKWMEYRESVGSVHLRHESIEIGKWVLQVYDLMPQWWRDWGAYDWESVPAIVGELTPGETSRDVQATADALMTSEHAKREYFRSASWFMKHRYGVTIEEAGPTQEEFLAQWFDPERSPEQAVDHYAEKYGLEKIQ